MHKHEYGQLYGVVPVELPSLEVADKLRTKARGNSFDKFGFAFPEQIHDDEDYFIYHFSPFFKRLKTIFSEWNQHTERGTEGDFYTCVQDGWGYQDAKVALLLMDEALDRWGCVEVAAARRDYENWKKSSDARQEKPENHAFYCLRECEEIAAYIPNADPPSADDEPTDRVVRAVATVENTEPASIDRNLEEIRTDPDEGLPPFFAELSEKVEALDGHVDHLTRNMKVYDANHPEGFPNLDLDHLAHLRGLMILVKLVLSDFRDDAKSLRETAECLEILGLKPVPKT